jgi:hypothetical protein
MSPDIEWHVGEDAEQETIVKTPQRKPPRWHAVAIMIAVGLGVALGVVYRSIPEPAPRPTPTSAPDPTLTPLPSSEPQVLDTIERESLALANGDLSTFMAIQDAADSAWRQTQLGLFRQWGTPTNGPLYTIVESGTLSADRLWVDMFQFRTGQYFRQTRFYQFKDQRWQRIAPASDPLFWGDEQSAETAHFYLKFHAQDALLAAILAQRYEAVYARACSDLRCRERNAFPANRKLQMVLQPYLVTPRLDLQNDRMLYTLSSPRLSGLYYPTRLGEPPGQDRSLNQAIVENIVYYVARTDASQLSTWPIDTTGQQFLGIISEWESLRLLGQPNRQLITRPEQLASPNLPDLASLWIMPPQFTSQLAELRWIESSALITFLDEQYGADKVVSFLHTLGQTSSLADTLKQLDLPDRGFEEQWQAWLKQAAMPD